VLDPGPGGDEVGSAHNGVVEKDSNLEMAFRVEKLLQAQGVDVVLTRRSNTRAAPQTPGLTATRSDLQARLDLANAAGGDVFVSLHSNGSDDPTQRGVEVWFDSERAFAKEGLWLAQLVQARVLAELRSYGHPALDRGLNDGRCFRMREGRCFTLFVIAGPRATSREEIIRRGGNPEALGFGDEPTIYSRPANMPAVLAEMLFVTNPADAAVLRSDAGRQSIALGLAKAILEFLELPYRET
jgi:N-acetylmuramoyl-L-alanine amidase